jgi:NAD(P)-dependent dehydrogenase (short-subunit alcohol dehydrogenase family)
MSVEIDDSTAFITGANGGLGLEFTRQLLERGGRRVYAADVAGRPSEDPRVVPLEVDVTDRSSIARAAAVAGDVDLVINNAGITVREPLSVQDLAIVRRIFDVNFFGAVDVVQEFAPVLARNGGGALVDVCSIMSWNARSGAYSAAKAALWSATNSFRIELAPQGTHVMGLYLTYTRTPLTVALDQSRMNDPADVVTAALDGLARGDHEVLADDETRAFKAGLSGPVDALYPELAPTV